MYSLLQPGETLSDQNWVELPNNGEAALQTEIVVGKVSEADEGEVTGWGAKDIVDLLDLKGNTTGTSDDDVEKDQLMVESKSKGSMRPNKEAMKDWEERVKEAENKQQERRRRSSKNIGGAASASG